LRDILYKIIMPFVGFILSIVPFSLNYSLKEFIIFGVPYIFLWSYCLYHVYNIMISQLIYFYITCFYLKSKIRSINNKIIRITTNKKQIIRPKISEILKSFDSIYAEIYEYNNNYWSKFLFVVWILLVIIISSVLYLTTYTSFNLVIRLTFIYGLILFTSWLFMIINTASSVNLETIKSYKLLNSRIIHLNSRYISILMRIKVKGFDFLDFNLNQSKLIWVIVDVIHWESGSEKSWILLLEPFYYKSFSWIWSLYWNKMLIRFKIIWIFYLTDNRYNRRLFLEIERNL